MNHLVIVESPTKAKTLKRYLSNQGNYEILPTYGHVMDLRPKEGAVEPDNHFAMHYEPIKKNAKHLDAIVQAAKKADILYLATDPDREGEAISSHVFEYLRDKKILKKTPVHRVVFHEITKNAIDDAFKHPRELARDLVYAQQARRALDYLVGFNLSPLLWRKIRPGLSAGRVQSPALRLIVEREEAIEQFKTQEYWTITATAGSKKETFNARLAVYDGEKLTQFSFTEAESVQKAVALLKKEANGKLTVVEVKKKQRKRNPAAPFITSTLQQESARKLGFTAKKTMQIAQQLYEGIDVGQGAVGLISYMRTDSVNLAKEAIDEIRQYIIENYGAKQLPDSPRVYQTKSKNAQEAHEAIRPTSIFRQPQAIKHYLSSDQFKLYELIWKRSLACQMLPAVYDVVSVDLQCGQDAQKHLFRANGSTLLDPGFMQVYQEGRDDTPTISDDEHSEANATLPPLTKGQAVDLQDIIGDQHFTEPPPRYSEASLIKALEEFGIGRPSTYASIISTLKTREYVVLTQKRFHPTDVGRIVNKFLTGYFQQYVDYDFTAKLEDALDEISRGEKQWVPLLEEFWSPFKNLIDVTLQTVQRKDVTQEMLEEKCPQCGNPLAIRLGKRGRFIGCTTYPECNYTRSLENSVTEEAQEKQVVEGRQCPDCQSELLIKKGRYGKFIGCSQYPKCKHMEPLEKPKDTGIDCPVCHKGKLLSRKSRYGKLFYSCSTYPACQYAVWNEPIEQACPKCHWPILTLKVTKRRGEEKVCPQKECGYAESINSEN